MADIAHRKADAIAGGLPGIQMHRVAADLDGGAFGISIIEMEPGTDAYPGHDRSPSGLGGEEGLRLLALGGTAGQDYLGGGTL